MALFRSFTILFILISLTSAFDGDERDSTGCPKAFKGRCKCGKVRNYRYWRSREEIYMVNCTNTMFRDTTMLEQLPSETEVLIFNGNNISQLDWNLFGIWDEHEGLEVVDLTNNNIRGISGKTFHKVKNVKRLLLDHNDLIISGPNLHPRLFSNFYNLEELHLTNTFTETVDSRWYLSDLKEILLTSNMTKLRKLHLEQNEIWEIKDDDMFCGLKSLSELYLGDNQLQGIEFSLQCLEQLSYVSLEYNKIRRLDDKTLRKLDQVFASDKSGRKTINLKGNPFRCDCHLDNFYDWLYHTNISFFHKEELRCFDGYPIENAGKSIMDLKRLECSSKSNEANGVHGDPEAWTPANKIGIVLFFLFLVLFIISVIYHRQRVSKMVKPLVEGFQKSMQYRTINREEEVPPPQAAAV